MAPVRREVRALLHILVGAAVLHISLFTELYLRYVRKGLRPYLIASGVLLVVVGLIGAVVAARELFRPGHRGDTDDGHGHERGHERGHEHGAPRTAWLLLLPVLAIYLLQPRALGAFTAQHSDNTAVKPAEAAGGFAPLPATDPVGMRLADFDSRALWDSNGSLKGHRIRLTGFATPGPGDGSWDLARLTISCCAADASSSKVVIHGADAPPEGAWVEVTGEWQPDGASGQDGAVPTLTAALVRRIAEPENPYE
ncbi:TIGR03943 family putative permease subunit [Kitasatospora sp. NPDC101155]|uniref:TIGR03943 family putative permease subunit n=1 Tax=Kitasatospora sp. NPDC101155 TaxID=3364097 RepID=UPI003807A1B6